MILQHLETETKDVYKTRDVQKLFLVGRSQAAGIMGAAGAVMRKGSVSIVSRDALLFFVRTCPETEAAVKEHDRKVRLARRLELELKNREYVRRFGALIGPLQKPLDAYTRFPDLVDTSIRDGALTIYFSSTADLANKIYLLAIAEANQPDEFDRLTTEAAPKQKLGVDLRDFLRPATPEEKAQLLEPLRFPPSTHSYVTHHTYTGPDCAMCGQPETAHQSMVASAAS